MTLDVLAAGYLVMEVECEIRHKAGSGDHRSLGKRANQYRDVMLAVGSRRVKGAATSTRHEVGERVKNAARRRGGKIRPDAVEEDVVDKTQEVDE